MTIETNDDGTRWQAWLAERPIAVIATVGEDAVPHAVPVEVVVHDGRVYSWCESTAVRVRNIARTGYAAIVAYRSHAFVLVRGRARLLRQDDPAYAAIAQRFLDKYQREETYGNDTLVEISPDRVSSDRIG